MVCVFSKQWSDYRINYPNRGIAGLQRSCHLQSVALLNSKGQVQHDQQIPTPKTSLPRKNQIIKLLHLGQEVIRVELHLTSESTVRSHMRGTLSETVKRRRIAVSLDLDNPISLLSLEGHNGPDFPQQSDPYVYLFAHYPVTKPACSLLNRLLDLSQTRVIELLSICRQCSAYLQQNHFCLPVAHWILILGRGSADWAVFDPVLRQFIEAAEAEGVAAVGKQIGHRKELQTNRAKELLFISESSYVYGVMSFFARRSGSGGSGLVLEYPLPEFGFSDGFELVFISLVLVSL